MKLTPSISRIDVAVVKWVMWTVVLKLVGDILILLLDFFSYSERAVRRLAGDGPHIAINKLRED